MTTVPTNNTGLMADTANNQCKVVRAGNYLCAVGLCFNSLTANTTRCIAFIAKNGTVTASQEMYGIINGFPKFIVVVPVLSFEVNDTLEAQAYQTTAAAQTVLNGGGTFISMLETPSW
jgi:cytochrome c